MVRKPKKQEQSVVLWIFDLQKTTQNLCLKTKLQKKKRLVQGENYVTKMRRKTN